MRKFLLLFLAVLLLSLGACAANDEAAWVAADAAPASAPAEAPAVGRTVLGLYGSPTTDVARMEFDDAGWAMPEEEAYFLSAAEADSPVPGSPAAATITPERIIHTARAEVETDEFDDTVELVYAMIERHGGFLQSANVSGRDFYAKQRDIFAHRHANFTIRVPAAQYGLMIQDIENLGAMTFLTTQADNVTAQYADITSRLASLRTQEERILELFQQADTMEDILFLEDRLSQVIFEIERFTWDRNHIDSLASYSTIYLTLREVRELVEIEDRIVEPSFVDRMGNAFSSTLEGMARFARGIILTAIMLLPWILVLGAFALIPFLILYRRYKKRKLRSMEKPVEPVSTVKIASIHEEEL